MESLQLKYQSVISELQKGNRGLYKLDLALKSELLHKWDWLLKQTKFSSELLNDWQMLFCLINHTTHYDPEFILKLKDTYDFFKANKATDDLWIYYINSFEKHTLSYYRIQSLPVDKKVLDTLMYFLESKNSEVLEWSLRVIESLEEESLYFEKAILNLRPSIFKMFNEHQRMSFQIVELLNKKWANYRARGK